MPRAAVIKPAHKAIKQYYAALQSYREYKMRLSKDKASLVVNSSLTLAGASHQKPSNIASAIAVPWSGLSTNTRSARTNGAASSPTQTEPTTRSTSFG